MAWKMIIKQALMYLVQYGNIHLDIFPSFPCFIRPSMISDHWTLRSAGTFCVWEGHEMKVTSLWTIPTMLEPLPEETDLFTEQKTCRCEE